MPIESNINATVSQEGLSPRDARIKIRFAEFLRGSVTYLIETGFRGYNLVRHEGRYWAVLQSLGPVDLYEVSEETMRAWCDQRQCLAADTLAELKMWVEESRYRPAPELIEAGYRGYNIVGFQARFVALAISLGPLDVSRIEGATLEEWERAHDCVIASSRSEVKARIDHWLAGVEPRPAASFSLPNPMAKEFGPQSGWNKEPTPAHLAPTFKLKSALLFQEGPQAWRNLPVDERVANPVPSMICPDEKLYMHWLARRYFTGEGYIVDLGPLAGGSTYSFASGLALNPCVREHQKVVHSYDLWHFFPSWDQFFPGETLQEGENLLPRFQRNLGAFGSFVEPHRGDLSGYAWIGRPIEILFIDAAKSEALWAHICQEFFPHLIPGRSLIVQQDWVCHECPWLHLTMTKFADYFEYVDSPDGGSVTFLLKKTIPLSLLEQDHPASYPVKDARSLFHQAAEQLLGWYQLFVRLTEAKYLVGAGELITATAVIEELIASPEYDQRIEPYVTSLEAQIKGAAGASVGSSARPVHTLDLQPKKGIEAERIQSSLAEAAPARTVEQTSQPWCSFLIPTRNNLPGLKKLFDSIIATTARPEDIEIVLAMDDDDVASQAVVDARLRLRKVVVPKGLTMGALNNACFEASTGRYIMLMNDDVVLRSKDWDRQVLAVYRGFQDDIALIHVNDLLFRERLCTFPMLSRRACQAIGLCPSAYRRYRIDDHIYDIYNLLAHLGHRRIIYLPDVIFEHENHEADAPPSQEHQFSSVDKKVYVPKAGIIEADAKYCDDHFVDRKAAALKLAMLIETDAYHHTLEGLRQSGTARLAALADSHSYRRPAYLRTQPTGLVRDSSNARTTVAVVTADLQSDIAQRCLQAIKAHTRNYDLVILDNNRGANFSHPREMNRVLETCSTEFLVLLDDDVIVEAGWLDGLLRCLDEETGVVVPLHKDRHGALSFSGIYFVHDGQGTHAHTLDRPEKTRVVQSYCSAAMLIDMQKCGHIRMDEAYHKYFFDLVHGFEVWEAGWKAVCCPDVTVTHLGGATMTWGSAEANAFLERDRSIFVRSWIQTGRMAELRTGPWQRHPWLVQLEELPERIEQFLRRALELTQAQFEQQLTECARACAPFKMLTHRMIRGLAEQIVTFAEKGDLQRIILSCRLVAASEPKTEAHWLLTALRPLLEAKQYRSAQELIEFGLERHSDELALWRALGMARMNLGELPGALVAFEEAVRSNPDDVGSQIGLGMVLFQLGEHGRAADSFSQAIRLCQKSNPHDPRIPLLTKQMNAAARSSSESSGSSANTPSPARSTRRAIPTQPLAAKSTSFLESSIPAPKAAVTPPEGASTERSRILLIPFECANWQNARAWSYNGYFAFEEGLEAAGVDFFTLPAIAGFPSDHPASWLNYARELCHGQHFDQVWIWLSHNEYQPALFEWLSQIAPIRVGVIMESMQHTAEELQSYALLPGRPERVGAMLRHLTHVLAFDEADAEALAADLPLRALWCPPIVSAASVCSAVNLPGPGPAVFYGTLYSPERRSFLEHPKLRGKLIQPQLPEDQADWPARFDAVQLASFNLLGQGQQPSVAQLEAHMAELRQVRRKIFCLWQQALQTSYVTVNLPSIYKGYAGRVVESMAAGRPVISWEPPRTRTRALFESGQEILLFDRSKPDELRRQIERLQKDPAWAHSLAEKAREKVLRHHTAEVRVRQILDWIEHDAQPDYGEVQSAAAQPARAKHSGKRVALRPDLISGAEVGTTLLIAAEQAVACAPTDADAWTRLARAALQAGRVDRFDAALARAMELNPNGRDALKLLGDVCVREGQIKNAVQSYHRILQSNPDDVPVLYGLGFTLEQAGEWESAFSVYDHLARIFPQDIVLAQRVRRLRNSRGATAPAATDAGRPSAPSNLPEKNPSASKSCDDAPARVVSATKVVKAPPACSLLGQIDQARSLLSHKNHRTAWDVTVAAIQSRPYHPEAYLLLAQLALSAGDGATARCCAQHARNLAPGWKAPKKFLKGNLRGQAAIEWMVLPGGLRKQGNRAQPPPPRLSVCLIVKNEAKFLGQCLESVRGLAQQLVVVDTGSTDDTVSIAQEHGAQVYSFAWCDDFSAARNAALEYVTGDWVLMLDADEVLAAHAHVQLRQQLEDAAVIGWRLPLVDVGREVEGPSYVPRLFRNAPGLFYTGRIHEQIFTGIERLGKQWGLEHRVGNSTLLHYGYTAEMTRDRNKAERNLHLLERAIAEEPRDPHLLMQLGMELARSGRSDQALTKYRAAFEALSALPLVGISPELRETLLTQYGTRLIAAKQYSEIGRILASPLACCQRGLTASLHYILGLAQLELGEFKLAADQFQLCLSKRDQRDLCPRNADILTAAPFHCLALCHIQLGDAAAAEMAFAQGLKNPGQADRLRVEFAQFLRDQNRPVDALRQLHDAISQNAENLAAWQLGGKISLDDPRFLEFACDWTGEAIRHLPKDQTLIAQRAEALLIAQRIEEAGELWQSLCKRDPQPSSFAALIFCALAKGESLPTVDGIETLATSRAFVDWYRKAVAAGARTAVLQVNRRLRDLQYCLPQAAETLEKVLTEAERSGEEEESCDLQAH